MMISRSLFAAVWLASSALAQPPLTTIQDVLYKADGTRFNGTLTISWTSFEAVDTSAITTQTATVAVVAGNLRVQLVPTTTAAPAASYTVKYNSDGRIQFSETWAVPSSVQPLRVRDVRLASTQAGLASADTVVTPVQESDVFGLVPDLGARPLKGPGYAAGRVALVNPSGSLESVTGSPSDCVRVDGSSGPCGTSGGLLPSFVDGDSPVGIVDGVNTTFTLSAVPNPSSSLALYRNGVLQKVAQDFTANGNAIQFVAADTPQPGDTLLASYRLTGTDTGSLPPNLPFESPLTFNPPLSRTVNAITLALCGVDGQILKYRTATGWTCEAEQVGAGGAGNYEPVDATILRQASLAGSGVALTPAHSDHLHPGVYEPVIAGGSAAQYLRGDKTLATFSTDALAATAAALALKAPLAGAVFTTPVTVGTSALVVIDPVTGITDPTAQLLPKFRLAQAKMLGGVQDVKILCIGDSTTQGYGSTSVPSVYGSYPWKLASLLTTRGLPSAPGLGIPRSQLSGAPDIRWTYGAGWADLPNNGWALGSAIQGTSPTGGVLTFTPGGGATYDSFDVYYGAGAGQGTITITATGGTQVVVDTSVGAHTLKATVVAAAAGTANAVTISSTVANVLILGVEPFLSTAQKVRVGNAGVGSARANGGWDSNATFASSWSIRGYAPDLTIISIGINDAIAGVASAAFQTSLATVIMNAQLSGDVILMTMPPSSASPTPATPVNEAQYQAAIRALSATYSVPILDIWGRFGGTFATSFMFDTWHPNNAGYWDIASAVDVLLQKLGGGMVVTGGGLTGGVTIDPATGNISTPGTISSGVGSGVATAIDFLQGATPVIQAASTFRLKTGPSIPVAFSWTVPSADAAGSIVSDGAGNLSIVGSTGTGNFVRATSPTIVTPTIASFVNAGHNHQNAAGGGTLTEAALAFTDITTGNVSATAHGFTPKLPNDATKFLNGAGGYSVPPGGSSTGCVPGGSAGQLLTDSGAGGCTSVTALPAASEPAHTGDVTNTAGSLAMVVAKVNGVAAATVLTRPIGTTWGDTFGSALVAGTPGAGNIYFTNQYACTISAWNITVDAGTATVDIWKIATGTAIPTVANTITASALPAIASGTALHSTTLTGWTTAVAANDILGFQLKTVATAKYVQIDLQCGQ